MAFVPVCCNFSRFKGLPKEDLLVYQWIEQAGNKGNLLQPLSLCDRLRNMDQRYQKQDKFTTTTDYKISEGVRRKETCQVSTISAG
jgi:hypothetical protein